MSIDALWVAYRDWLKQHVPLAYDNLAPGASPEQVDEVERVIGQSLPTALRELWRLNNGQKETQLVNNVKRAIVCVPTLSFLSTTHVIEVWRTWDTLRREDAGIDELQECGKSLEEGVVQPLYTHAGWLPLWADPGRADYIGIDLAPGERGQVGQIINFGRDEEEHWSPTADLAGLLQILLEEVNSGKWLATSLPADEGETPLPWFGDPEGHFFNALHGHWRKRMPRTGKDALAEAKAAAKAGEPQQALELAAEARSLGLATAQVYAIEARALEGLQRFEEAASAWQQAHELDPRSGNNSWPRLLNLVHNLGRYAEAEQLLGPELKLFPNSSRLWRLLGLAIGYHQGRIEEALTACEKACNVVTSGVEDLGQYAWTLGAAGRSTDAVTQAKEALGSGADGALVVKLTFYIYALGDEAERSEQLAELRELFLENETAEEWNFQPIIDTATRNGHPEAAWLAPLAAVANGADVGTIAQWQAWNGA